MNDWKKELKSRFDDFQIGEPEGLWDSIEKSIPEKKGKVIPFWWIAGAVAAAAALAVFVVPSGRNNGKLSEPVAIVEVAPASSGLDNILVDNTDIADKMDSKSFVAEIIPRTIVHKSSENTYETQAVESVENQSPIQETTAITAHDNKAVFIPSEVPEKETQFDERLLYDSEKTETKKKHSISYNISTSASSSSSHTISGYGSAILDTRSDITTGTYAKMNSLLATNRPTEKTVKHRMPARISFDLIYNITDHVGVGTGLSRTALYSDIHSGSSTLYSDSEQKMVLIGIPLSVYYDIPLSGRLFGLYASVGCMWEKAVDYSLDSRDYIGGKLNSYNNYSKDLPDYDQWSINAVAGGYIRLYKNSGWSLFAEAGVSKHFKNGSDIPTIYNDKPLMPLVNLGLRYSIND